MSMFLCQQCDQMRDSDDGCEEGANFGLICEACISDRDDHEAYHTSDSPATEYERVERMREEMQKAITPDGPIIPPDEKSEAEYRRKIAEGGVQYIAHSYTVSAAAFEKAMAPDYSRKGIFQTHNCYQCNHGELPCKQGAWNRCDNPRARND